MRAVVLHRTSNCYHEKIHGPWSAPSDWLVITEQQARERELKPCGICWTDLFGYEVPSEPELWEVK